MFSFVLVPYRPKNSPMCFLCKPLKYCMELSSSSRLQLQARDGSSGMLVKHQGQ